MLIGIDVGGTFTDGVLFSNGSVVHRVKRLTDEADLKGTLLGVLDDLLSHGEIGKIKRIVLSTTLVTNLLATGRGERTALLLMPGSGLPYSAYRISPDTYFLKGSIDFRGREIQAPDKKEVEAVLDEIQSAGIQKVAVAGKFSNRNARHELLVKEIANIRHPQLDVCTSNEISGRLNFPRRATTCYYTAMTLHEWNRFADAIEKAVRARTPSAELQILKADGGTITLDASRKHPCETVLSGPAASTMGAVALSRDPVNSVVVDIGGTTSDLSLLIEGQPLYASKGAMIGGHLTHINAFAVNSLALGGDSPVSAVDGEVKVGPRRYGVAACFGGETATVTDAFNVNQELGLGDPEQSRLKLESTADALGVTVETLSRQVIDIVIGRLRDGISFMFSQWENEPAYKVWEVVNRRKFTLHRIIGIGAAAPAIVPLLARELQVDYLLHDYAPVANALGAAVVRPTLAVELHVDTQNRVYTVSPGGIEGKVEGHNFQLEDARNMARNYLQEISREREMESYAGQAQFYQEEQFNVIRGWDRVGKLFDIGIQISPGFIDEYKGVAQ